MTTTTATPSITRQLVKDKSGTYFWMWWDETNGTIHMIENSQKDTIQMLDFELCKAKKAKKK